MSDTLKGLRILTGKTHLQKKLKRLRKVGICAFGKLIHQINSIKSSYTEIKFSKNKVAIGKTAFFLICRFCTPHFIFHWPLAGQFSTLNS